MDETIKITGGKLLTKMLRLIIFRLSAEFIYSVIKKLRMVGAEDLQQDAHKRQSVALIYVPCKMFLPLHHVYEMRNAIKMLTRICVT